MTMPTGRGPGGSFPGPGAPGGPGAGQRPPTAATPASRPDKPVTRRLISRNRLFAIVLALLTAGLLAALLFLGDRTSGNFVVRAAKPISAGTVVVRSQLEAIQMDDAYIEEGAFSAKTAEAALDKAIDFAEGQVVQYPVAARQQVTENLFSVSATLGEPLGPDERLMSVRAQIAASVGGTLKVGDVVDVVAVGADGSTAGLVATAVPVAGVTVGEQELSSAAGTQLDEANRDKVAVELLPGQPIPGTFILRVRLYQMNALAVSDASANRLFLVLRGTDATNQPVNPIQLNEAICGAALATTDRSTDPAGQVAPPPAFCAGLVATPQATPQP